MDLLSRPGRRRRRWKPGVGPESRGLAPLQRHSLVLLLIIILLCHATLIRATAPVSSLKPNATIPQHHDTRGQQLAANPARFRPRATYQASFTAPLQPHASHGIPQAPPILWRREVLAPDASATLAAAPTATITTSADVVSSTTTKIETLAAPSPPTTTATKTSPAKVESAVEPAPPPTTTIESPNVTLPPTTISDTSVVNLGGVKLAATDTEERPIPSAPSTATTTTTTSTSHASSTVKSSPTTTTANFAIGKSSPASPSDNLVVNWSAAVEGTSAWIVGYNAAKIAVTTSPLAQSTESTADASPASSIVLAGVPSLDPGGVKLAADNKGTVVVSSSNITDANGTPVSFIGYNSKMEPVATSPLVQSPSIYTTVTQVAGITDASADAVSAQELTALNGIKFTTITQEAPPATIVYALSAGQTVMTSTRAQVAANTVDPSPVTSKKTTTQGDRSGTIVYGLDTAGHTVFRSTTSPGAGAGAIHTPQTITSAGIAVSLIEFNAEGSPTTTIPVSPTNKGQEADTDTVAISSITTTQGDRSGTVVYGLDTAGHTVFKSTTSPGAGAGAIHTPQTITSAGIAVSLIKFNAEGSPTITIPISPTDALPKVVTSSTTIGDGNVVSVIDDGSAMESLSTSTLKSTEEPVATVPSTASRDSAIAEGGSPTSPTVTRTVSTVLNGRTVVQVYEVDGKGSAVTIRTQMPTISGPDSSKTPSVNAPVLTDQQPNDNDGSSTTIKPPVTTKQQANDIGGSPTDIPASPSDITLPPLPTSTPTLTSSVSNDVDPTSGANKGPFDDAAITTAIEQQPKPENGSPTESPASPLFTDVTAEPGKNKAPAEDSAVTTALEQQPKLGSGSPIESLTSRLVTLPPNVENVSRTDQRKVPSDSSTPTSPVEQQAQRKDGSSAETATDLPKLPSSPSAAPLPLVETAPNIDTKKPPAEDSTARKTQEQRPEGLDNRLQASPTETLQNTVTADMPIPAKSPGTEAEIPGSTLTSLPGGTNAAPSSISTTSTTGPPEVLKTDTAKETTPEAPKDTAPAPIKTSSSSNPYAWVPTSTLLQNPSANEAKSEDPAATETQASVTPVGSAKLANEPKSSEESQSLASSTADAKAALPSEWPSSIVPQQASDDLENGDQSEAVGLVGAKTAQRPADTSLISILFTKALSWSWLLSQGDASGQVFAYMPVLIATSLGLDSSEIVTISLEAWKPANWTGDGADVRSVWVGHMPSRKVDYLAALMVNTSSELYNPSQPITKQLSTCIDPSLPLLTLQNSLGIDPSGASTVDEPDENAGKMSNKTTAFVASAAALGATVLAVGAFFGSRYAMKKRKIAAEDSLHGSRYSGSDSSFSSPPQHRNMPAFSSAAAPRDDNPLATPMDAEEYARDSEYYGTQSDYPVTERDSMRDTYASRPPTGPLPPPPEAYRQSTNSETIAPLSRNGASSYYPTERSYRTTLQSGSGSSVQSEILGTRQASMEIPIRDTWWKHASQWNDAGGQGDAARGHSVMSDPAPKSGRIVTLDRPFSASTYSTLRTADGGGINSANPFSQGTPFGQRLPSTKASRISAPYLQDNSLML